MREDTLSLTHPFTLFMDLQGEFDPTSTSLDRIVHHSAILEFDVPGYQTSTAGQHQEEEVSDRQESLTPADHLRGCAKPDRLLTGLRETHPELCPSVPCM